MSVVSLDALTLDEELQPRAAIDRTVLEDYVQLLVDGVRFPPVVAFREASRDGSTLWLSDGFHRWHAHKVIDADGIEVTIHEGSRRQALLYSLSANSKHGLQRGATDYRRAYEIACRNGLVDPADVEAVAALLQCSGRWAEKLTEKARQAVKEQRDAQIIRLKDEGLSNREVARETGIPRRTVDRSVGGPKANGAEMAQPADPAVWRREMEDLSTAEAGAWSSALQALRFINQLQPVDELFGGRFDRFDYALSQEVENAHDWINEFHRRFVNERAQRRRA